ncbi:MAG: LptF/LptG family permease [Planctomycetota bacterium]|nr:LptF/LptG family permease [Planctomycetota bacterium]MDA1251353.1 LptF/LptG family permease [Planctomycetota bacterium]
MHTLQRYIFKELVRVLLIIILVLTVLLVFVGVFREVSESGLGPLQVLQILPYVVPSMLPFTIPATLLLAVCVVYGRLSADHEITAAKAAGVNAISLLLPAFFLGTVLTVFSLLLNDQVIPWSVANIQRIATLAMEDIFFDVLASQNLVEDPANGVTITVSRVDREQRKLIRPIIRFSPNGDDPVIVQAEEATLRFDLEHEQAVLRLKEAHVDAPGEISMKLKDREFAFPLTLGGKIKPRHKSIQQIRKHIAEIRDEIRRSQEEKAVDAAFTLAMGQYENFVTPEFQSYDSQIVSSRTSTNKHRTELHNRFALSCSCFFFALVGGPFSIVQARRQFLTTFFLCFVPILLIYYPVVLLMMNLAKHGAVDPAWAMWTGNIILLLAAWRVIGKAVQH